MSLKYYTDEILLYTKESNMKLSTEEAERMANKLIRHFKLDVYDISFKSGSTSYCKCWTSEIPRCRLCFSKTHLSVLIVAHECAHALDLLKHRRNVGHCKKHKTSVKRMINYIRKKNYWLNDKQINLENTP